MKGWESLLARYGIEKTSEGCYLAGIDSDNQIATDYSLLGTARH